MPSEAPPDHPPAAPARPVETVHHGRARVDAYDWLRDKHSPEVRAHLDAENAWTAARTEHLGPLRQRIFDEIKGHTLETDQSVPTRNRGWWYYGRTFEGRQYGATCRVPVLDPDDWTPPRPDEAAAPDRPALPGEEVLLDLDALAEGHDFFSLGGSSVSPDGTRLAYSTDVVGDERYTVRFLDLGSRELAPDELTGVLGGVTWDRAGASVYYTTVDESWRSDKVWRHRLGTVQADDELVWHETDARFSVGVGRTRTDRFVVVMVASKTTSEVWLLDADEPGAGRRLVHERTEGLEYGVEHGVLGGEDVLLIVHNGRGPDFELATLPLADLGDVTGPPVWTPLIAHRPGVRIEDVDAFATHLVVSQRSDGLTQLRILDLDDEGVSDDRLIEFDDPVYTVGAGGNPDFHQPTVRLGYTTLATPPSTFDHHVASRELRLLRQAPVLEFDPADYVEHRTWATAPDGTRVPVSYVLRRDVSGPVPFLLYGYGSYEISIDPYFSVARLSLLDRGAGFAIAHVRGGGEMGRHWYDDGKLHRKQHTFDDFIACGRHLLDSGIASALVAEGGSAGGLLVGAVVTQAPDLWAGAVADVPFVDPLTSMLDSSLPLTVTEYDEWGNPEGDPAAYDDIAAYAPYDTVTAGAYPPILAETSLHDTRVLYVEPAKWVARLRATDPTGAGRPDVLLKTEMSAGHGGVSGRYQAWHDRAFSLAWILDRLGRAAEG